MQKITLGRRSSLRCGCHQWHQFTRASGPIAALHVSGCARLVNHRFIHFFLSVPLSLRDGEVIKKDDIHCWCCNKLSAACDDKVEEEGPPRTVKRRNRWRVMRMDSSRPIRRWSDGAWTHGSKLTPLHVWWAAGRVGLFSHWQHS